MKHQSPKTHQLREGLLARDAVVDLGLVEAQNLAQDARLAVEEVLGWVVSGRDLVGGGGGGGGGSRGGWREGMIDWM